MISTRKVFLGGFFALAFLAVSASAIASQYAPWQMGDHAIYQGSRGDQVRATIDSINGSNNHYTNFAGLGALWVQTSSTNERVLIYSSVTRKWQLLVDFNAAAGATQKIDIDPCNRGSVTLAAKNESLQTPAGKFTDVIRLDFRTSCADAGVTNAWFARGTGLVQWSSSNIAGAVTYSMVSGSIGGVVYPKPAPGIALLAEFPDAQVWINRMPGIGAPETPAVEVYLTLQNNSTQSLTYSLGSTQLFDILIIDTNGRVVSRWSRGRMFAQVMSTITIPAGGKQRFGGQVLLTYDDGQLLAPGGYTLKIELSSTPAANTAHPPGTQAPTAMAPIELGWVF